ncbi:MAG TPA: signal peptidase I [Candidatus Acidoferrales bacterium]|nr:signal peptidase I [Candidatus Acidoferrales bacterium]
MPSAQKTSKRKTKGKEQKPEVTAGDKVRRELISWFWVILAFFLIEAMVIQARVIPSASMEGTILIGDHLIISLLGYDVGIPFTEHHIALWRNPKRQQIIVFEAPPQAAPNEDFIKRVIGLPGDTVVVKRGVVFVNGEQLNEPYLNPLPDPSAQQENTGPFQVPPGQYFVMGDNRDDSNDSRFWGCVPRANIIGTPLFIYMSVKAPDDVWEPGHFGDRLATYLSILIHPSEMRWRRLFRTF